MRPRARETWCVTKEKEPIEVMDNELTTQPHGMEDVEIQEWLESLDSVLESSGPEVAAEILERLRAHATVNGIDLPFTRSEEHTSELQSRLHLVCRLLLEKKNND